MTTMLPRRAWLAFLAVLWALPAPWVLGFDGSPAALANHIAFSMAFAPLALLALTPLPGARAACLLGAAWLAASPWLLGYAPRYPAAWVNDLATAATLAFACLRCSSRVAPAGTFSS